MELLQLKYFLTVSRMLNISKAAEYHRIPQPAMSKTISRLEKELGTELFKRQKNKISLTDEGNQFFRQVSHALGELDEAVLSVQKEQEMPHGEISILVREHRSYVIQCIVEFKKKYPNVRFKVYYDEKAANYYDFCISSIPVSRGFDQSTMLLSEKMQLIVSSRSPLACRETITVSDLKQQEFALISARSHQWKSISESCSKAGFVPKLAAEFGDIQCLAEYVSLGMAVTVGPKSSYSDLGKDLSFLDFVPEIRRPVFLFWHKENSSGTMELFKDSIVDFFYISAAAD